MNLIQPYEIPERRCDAELSWESVEFNKYRNKPTPDRCFNKSKYLINGVVYLCKRHAQQWALDHILEKEKHNGRQIQDAASTKGR